MMGAGRSNLAVNLGLEQGVHAHVILLRVSLYLITNPSSRAQRYSSVRVSPYPPAVTVRLGRDSSQQWLGRYAAGSLELGLPSRSGACSGQPISKSSSGRWILQATS